VCKRRQRRGAAWLADGQLRQSGRGRRARDGAHDGWYENRYGEDRYDKDRERQRAFRRR